MKEGRDLEVRKYQLEGNDPEAEIIREDQDLEAVKGSPGGIALLVPTESF